MSSNNPFSTLINREALTARLAVLQPAERQDAPIELTLMEAVLKDTSYECISYDRSSKAVSAADNTMTVSVDGVPQVIPKQLGEALRTFRRKERPRTLWADVLVGRTPAELSAQAGTQRAVLEGAERTLCWLGPDKGESTVKAFAIITEMGRRFSEACRSVGIEADDKLAKATIQQMDGIRTRLHNCPTNDLDSFNFDLWDEIYDIFGASYWGTVQAVADVVLARAPIVVCGRGNIRWFTYIAASRAVPLFKMKFFATPLLPHMMKGMEIANQIEVAVHRKRLGESIELLPMVQTARDCGPHDIRDSVFSMVLIATPSKRLEFHNVGPQPLPKIDYEKTPQQVFIETARYTILERQDLLLWYGERPPCAKRLKGLPSWVPDFGAIPPRTGANFNPNGGLRHWWDAIRPESAREPIKISADNVLHLQARPLDRIVHVSSIFNGGNAKHLCYKEFQKMHAAMSATPNPFSGEPPATTIERFWRTLVLNTGGSKSASSTLHDNIAPPNSLATSFESVLAEEGMLAALDCSSMHELQTSENITRISESPELMALAPRCGKSEPYEQLLIKNTTGRRFFRTEGGRFGMTAVEDVRAVDPHLERDAGAEAVNENDDVGVQVEKRRMADLGRTMSDPMSRVIMQQFQSFLYQRDPNMARIHAKAVRGALPEMSEAALGRLDDGVKEGDLIVACVGGFFPYILRPQQKEAGASTGTETQSDGREDKSEGNGKSKSVPTEATAEASTEDSSTYEFVGECYLHGAMQGEDFQATRLTGQKYFDVDVSKLVDIKIV